MGLGFKSGQGTTRGRSPTTAALSGVALAGQINPGARVHRCGRPVEAVSGELAGTAAPPPARPARPCSGSCSPGPGRRPAPGAGRRLPFARSACPWVRRTFLPEAPAGAKRWPGRGGYSLPCWLLALRPTGKAAFQALGDSPGRVGATLTRASGRGRRRCRAPRRQRGYPGALSTRSARRTRAHAPTPRPKHRGRPARRARYRYIAAGLRTSIRCRSSSSSRKSSAGDGKPARANTPSRGHYVNRHVERRMAKRDGERFGGRGGKHGGGVRSAVSRSGTRHGSTDVGKRTARDHRVNGLHRKPEGVELV